jgi:hypothetical protein
MSGCADCAQSECESGREQQSRGKERRREQFRKSFGSRFLREYLFNKYSETAAFNAGCTAGHFGAPNDASENHRRYEAIFNYGCFYTDAAAFTPPAAYP